MGGGKGSICTGKVWDESTQGQTAELWGDGVEEEKDTPNDGFWTRGNRSSWGPMPIAKKRESKVTGKL